MTIDDFAIATQQEFDGVRSEMKELKKELKVDIFHVLRTIEAVDIHLSAYASNANDDIAKLQGFVEEHDGRLRVLEKGR